MSGDDFCCSVVVGGFPNCYDICICVVNKQFELLEFVIDSIYVVLQYYEIFLSLLLLGLCPCVVSVVMWSYVRLLWYSMWMLWLL